MSMDYKQSGVDVDLADKFVEKIKRMVGKTYDSRTMSGVGGFAALYKMDEDRFLAASTDGVGTKLKLAIDVNIHHTIGIDLVAMCVNDLICTGAKPMFFLDYFATGKLELGVAEKVLEGIVEGCIQGKLALIGGETAEMPGMYATGDYDLAGFSVGEVYKKDLLDGSLVKSGDTLVGIASSGFHSNGYSLVRKVIDSVTDTVMKEKLMKECLTPTKIYVKTFEHLTKVLGKNIKGIANITGSGMLNIPRINESFDYELSYLPKDIPWAMTEVMQRTGLSREELSHTFNMGIGMVIATDKPDECLAALKQMDEKAWVIGKVIPGKGDIHLL
ncbi:MAG TPA: phosphoribosylformylglycinamidine cyclo-ligase [Bacteriovoracaceae bacterium]|nr:phosphoribosylformylglycinamidine cyclo-ligase [Bacteriovoracaceae bacterium]